MDSSAKIVNAKSVNKALVRLVKLDELERVTQGIYVRSFIDDYYIGKAAEKDCGLFTH